MKFLNIHRLIWITMSLVFLSCLPQETKKESVPEKPQESQSEYQYYGKIKEIVMFKGTLSQYRYFVLEDENFGQKIIFNSNLYSSGFEKYVDKNVRIKGKIGTGFIGWRKIKKEGIIVESISDH